jgi:hypothetical protein
LTKSIHYLCHNSIIIYSRTHSKSKIVVFKEEDP